MKNKNSKRNVILYVIEGIVLLTAIGFLYLISQVTDKVQKVQIDKSNLVINDKAEITSSNEQLIQEVKAEMPKDVYRNIVLFGVDSREKQLSSGTRTDTIIIASINETTKEIKLLSVFRDTYLNTGDDTYKKANAAYAIGGPNQAINMLNMNLDLNITDYITMGFLGLMDTVDAVGGIPIDIAENEIEHLNNYQICMSEELGIQYVPVTKAGLQTLDGLQATAYCRIRYTAGNDFKRSERQRKVIMEITEKAKKLSIADLTKVMDSILPEISTSLSVEEMVSILPELVSYTITNNEGFPFQSNRAVGTIGKKGSCVIPDSLEENVILLHEFLYNEKDYIPSDKVKKISSVVQSDTSPYL